MLTRSQVRMARAALGWGVRELGRRAGIAANTVSRYENGAGTTVDTLARIQEVLEKAGVIFIPADDTAGPGVRLQGPTKAWPPNLTTEGGLQETPEGGDH